MSNSDTILSQFEQRLGESTWREIDSEPLITQQGLDHIVIEGRAEMVTWDDARAIVENATWYEVLKIAHDYMESSQDYDRCFFAGLNPDDSTEASGLSRYAIFLGYELVRAHDVQNPNCSGIVEVGLDCQPQLSAPTV